ncbi:STM4015 family protein [Streptomyces phaeoluteigriseus]|uniref:STM4015 family protein n=1 Tax=Streptomyces phaeoluteigriseus TaxID=114686 RepID=A0ABY4Z7E1_9ACTN|nr:STM4015 family protein [Streptomyces phaeoluteigriseus]USQ84969.1 STM4015 family protein [Streptomyces phaeoluteigriseus]
MDHIAELHGLPVHHFPAPGQDAGTLPAAETVAWRLSTDEDRGGESFEEGWERFLDTVDPARVRALVLGVGAYGSELDAADPATTAKLLADAAGRLTGLEALYLADLTFEECELSWIVQGDVTPILAAYPRLEELAVRGSNGGFDGEPGLDLTPIRHERLRTLRFENGGLPSSVARGVAASDLPALERLDMWLGTEDYGRDASVADLAPILDGGRLPALRDLGLRNADIQDEIAAAVAAAPVVARLSTLRLSLGTLGDAGAEALLGGQPLTHLAELDLHHHYLSEPMTGRLREALEPSGVRVDLDDRQRADAEGHGRYVSAGE